MYISADDGWRNTMVDSSRRGKLRTPEHSQMTNPPPENISPIKQYPEMDDNNITSLTTSNKIIIDLPGPGTYLVEIDYTECCDGYLTLGVTSDFFPELS